MSSNSVTVRKKGHKICLDHAKRELIFTCDNCEDTPICDICITAQHKGHNVSSVALGAEERFQWITKFNTRTQEETIPKFKKAEKAAELVFKDFKEHVYSEISNVEVHKKYLKQLIDTIADQNIFELTDLLAKSKNDFKESQADLNNRIQKLQTLLIENLKVLDFGNNILLVDVMKDLKKFNVDLPLFQLLPELKFNAEVLEVEKRMKQVFGCITMKGKKLIGSKPVEPAASYVVPKRNLNIENGTYNSRINKTAKESVEHQLRMLPSQRKLGHPEATHKLMYQAINKRTLSTSDIFANRTAATRSGTVCFIEKDSYFLYLIQENIYPEMITEINLGQSYMLINDIAVNTINDELYCIRRRDRSVCCMDKMTRTLTKLFTADGNPKCLDFTQEDDILIGDFKRPMLQVYSQTGMLLQSVTYKGKPPNYLTVCRRTGKVAVVCRGSPEVIVMDSSLEELYRYDGPPATSVNDTFAPVDAKFDNYGNLLISDCNKGVRIVSAEDGNHLKTIRTQTWNQMYVSLLVGEKEVMIGVGVSSRDDTNIYEPFELVTMQYIK